MEALDLQKFEKDVTKSALRIFSLEALQTGRFAIPNPEELSKSSEQQDALALLESKKLLESDVILKRLCPALKTISSDLKEVSKIVTTALIPLAFLPVPLIALSPIIFGGIAVIIVRAGINSFCPEEVKGKE